MSRSNNPAAPYPHPGPGPIAGDSVFDHPAALARVDGDGQFLSEMAELFVDDGPARLGTMETALTAEALAEVERLAHNLRGAACYFVARAAVAAAQGLETAAARGDLVQAKKDYRILMREVERLLGRLRAIIGLPGCDHGLSQLGEGEAPAEPERAGSAEGSPAHAGQIPITDVRPVDPGTPVMHRDKKERLL